MSDRIVKLALVQFQSVLGDTAASVEKACKMIDEAGKQGADLVIFPELATTGYHLATIGPDLATLTERVDGPSVTALREAAARNRVNLIVGISLEYDYQPGVPYNSSVIIDRDGNLMGTFDKVHLWAGERFWFRGGCDFPVFDMDFGRVGVMICYDAGFPEAARSLAMQGAEIIACPSAWCVQDKDIWETNMPCRALENTVFLAAVNRWGAEGDDLYMHGGSMVCNPRGHKLGQIEEEKEDILYVDVDLNDILKNRVTSPYMRDRRVDAYDMTMAY